MRNFRIAAVIALVALSLGGCAQLNDGWSRVRNTFEVVTSAKVSPEAIVLLASTFDAFEVTAKNYIDPQLNKRCTGSNGPICRDPGATKAINQAVRSGRVARDNAKQFLRDHPGELGTQGLYDALKASVDTLRSIFDQYGIKTPGGVL
jgi:hypothetical protein